MLAPFLYSAFILFGSLTAQNKLEVVTNTSPDLLKHDPVYYKVNQKGELDLPYYFNNSGITFEEIEYRSKESVKKMIYDTVTIISMAVPIPLGQSGLLIRGGAKLINSEFIVQLTKMVSDLASKSATVAQITSAISKFTKFPIVKAGQSCTKFVVPFAEMGAIYTAADVCAQDAIGVKLEETIIETEDQDKEQFRLLLLSSFKDDGVYYASSMQKMLDMIYDVLYQKNPPYEPRWAPYTAANMPNLLLSRRDMFKTEKDNFDYFKRNGLNELIPNEEEYFIPRNKKRQEALIKQLEGAAGKFKEYQEEQKRALSQYPNGIPPVKKTTEEIEELTKQLDQAAKKYKAYQEEQKQALEQYPNGIPLVKKTPEEIEALTKQLDQAAEKYKAYQEEQKQALEQYPNGGPKPKEEPAKKIAQKIKSKNTQFLIFSTDQSGYCIRISGYDLDGYDRRNNMINVTSGFSSIFLKFEYCTVTTDQSGENLIFPSCISVGPIYNTVTPPYKEGWMDDPLYHPNPKFYDPNPKNIENFRL